MFNVLSLFDGMSCGQIALNRVGIKYDNYFASEIDKYAIKITQSNYPKTIQLGDVTSVKAENLPSIDLLIGGSPCQGFSVAGKGLNFVDPRSKLFFEFARLLKECKPKYFLLENVKMKKEYADIITEYLGVTPIKINSADFSAQNRERYYWTNIPINFDYEKNNQTVEDILEDEVDAKYLINEKKQMIIVDNEVKRGKLIAYFGKKSQGYCIYGVRGKSVAVLPGNKAIYALPVISPDRLIKRQNGRRFKPPYSKAFTLTATDRHGVLVNDIIRKLTPIECERLQTVPDRYTDFVSDSQRFKCLGNGWTVDVIAHIFKGIRQFRSLWEIFGHIKTLSEINYDWRIRGNIIILQKAMAVRGRIMFVGKKV